VKGVDIIIVFVKHEEYYKIKPEWFKKRMSNPIVVDGRDVFNLSEFRRSGFIAYGVGKPDH
jgi:UDP-N-acetyl-D-mannosaminuronate dehydrogenase